MKVSAKGCDPEIRGFSVQNASDEVLIADGEQNPIMLHPLMFHAYLQAETGFNTVSIRRWFQAVSLRNSGAGLTVSNLLLLALRVVLK